MSGLDKLTNVAILAAFGLVSYEYIACAEEKKSYRPTDVLPCITEKLSTGVLKETGQFFSDLWDWLSGNSSDDSNGDEKKDDQRHVIDPCYGVKDDKLLIYDDKNRMFICCNKQVILTKEFQQWAKGLLIGGFCDYYELSNDYSTVTGFKNNGNVDSMPTENFWSITKNKVVPNPFLLDVFVLGEIKRSNDGRWYSRNIANFSPKASAFLNMLYSTSGATYMISNDGNFIKGYKGGQLYKEFSIAFDKEVSLDDVSKKLSQFLNDCQKAGGSYSTGSGNERTFVCYLPGGKQRKIDIETGQLLSA